MSPVKVPVVTLVIDGKDASARADQTILEVARENAIDVPTLCFLDGLSGWGACRLCVVEIAGTPTFFTAVCTITIFDLGAT